MIADISVDQGGCVATTRPTTWADPTFVEHGVVHFSVTNMPGAVPYTSTLALTNATLPYAIQLANKGWKKACQENEELKLGLNVINGKIVYKGVSDAFGYSYTDVSEFL